MEAVSEHDTQVAFIQRLKLAGIEGVESSFAVPNGGQRHKAVAAKLKAEGAKPGVPDWLWPEPRGGFMGLAIEFKHGDGNPSKEQRERIDALQAKGWCVVVCWTWEAAYRTVVGYAAMLKVQMP